jgi:hypothetical protein
VNYLTLYRKSNQAPPEEGVNPKMGIIWRAYFNIVNPEVQSELPTNVHVISDPSFTLTYDDAVKKAEEIFHHICPDEEFIPKVPNPEDIIFVRYFRVYLTPQGTRSRESYGRRRTRGTRSART